MAILVVEVNNSASDSKVYKIIKSYSGVSGFFVVGCSIEKAYRAAVEPTMDTAAMPNETGFIICSNNVPAYSPSQSKPRASGNNHSVVLFANSPALWAKSSCVTW